MSIAEKPFEPGAACPLDGVRVIDMSRVVSGNMVSLQLAWDHVSSALDGRESAFEMHASGGMPNWRGWLRRNFRDYNRLANAVLQQLDLPMPKIDLASIGTAPIAARRTVTPPPAEKA